MSSITERILMRTERLRKARVEAAVTAVETFSKEQLVDHIVSLKCQIKELEDELDSVRMDLVTLENEEPEVAEKCESCIMPLCKTQLLVMELESVISTFKKEKGV